MHTQQVRRAIGDGFVASRLVLCAASLNNLENDGVKLAHRLAVVEVGRGRQKLAVGVPDTQVHFIQDRDE